jgi:hypothetical protein
MKNRERAKEIQKGIDYRSGIAEYDHKFLMLEAVTQIFVEIAGLADAVSTGLYNLRIKDGDE